jgi:hypothetical protein
MKLRAQFACAWFTRLVLAFDAVLKVQLMYQRGVVTDSVCELGCYRAVSAQGQWQ